MSKMTELVPDKINYITEEIWAVFVIKRPYQGRDDVSEQVTQLVSTHNSEKEAIEYIKKNHCKGVHYFICEGFCMG